MKKFNYTFAAFAIVAAIIFVLTGAFFSGTVKAPSSFWITTVKKSGVDVMEASATFNLDRTRKTEDKDEQKTDDISAAYIFIGEIYSPQNGNATVYFDFKTEYSADDRYVERESVELSENSRYGWTKVFSDKKISSCSKVKVHTSSEIEIGEIVFLFEDGTKIPVTGIESQTAYGENERKNGKYAVDEQNFFSLSDALKYNLTSFEKDEMSVAYGLFTGGKTIGYSPLTTLFNGVSVLVFGRNTFAIRFFSLVFGYVSIIMIYLIFYRLFGKDEISLLACVSVLAFGAVFASVGVASVGVPTFFILWAYYLAFGFYAREVKFEDKRATAFNLILTGVAVGLALSCGVKNIVALIGIPVVWGFAIKNLSKEFEREFESNAGIKKDNIFVAYQRKKNAFAKLLPTCFVLIPVALTTLFYAISAKALTTEYGYGFLRSALFDAGKSFKIDFSPSSFLAFVGTGFSADAIPKYVSLFSLLFVWIAFFFGDKKLKSAARAVGRKFILMGSAFIPLFVSYLLGYGDGAGGFGATSVFYSGYIPLLICVVGNLKDEKTYKGLIVGCIILFAASFMVNGFTLKLIFNL